MSQATYIRDMITDTDKIVRSSEIASFYDGKNVLITGGTGFLGLLFTERILRSCSGVKTLFLIVRAKKGKNPQERFDELFNDVIFGRLKREKPGFARKVVLIEGDMALIGLGLSPEQRELLKSTHIVIHGAATVRFNEQLRIAANINVRGTRELLSLAKEMANLKAFVHISTAYSHCVSDVVDEDLYAPPIDPDRLLNLLDILDDASLNHLTPVLMGRWPNTYAFTKAVAEDVVRRNWQSLPLCIVRPSMVIATAKEPVAGWTNNIYGPTGIVIGIALGLLRTMHVKPDMIPDLIPADYVINNALAAAWDIAKNQSLNPDSVGTATSPNTEKLPIYNITSSAQNPITWRQVMEYTEKHALPIPSMKCIWYYSLTLIEQRWLYNVYVVFLHYIPAAIVDTLLWITGRKPMLWAGYTKISKFLDLTEYFKVRQWQFNDYNVRKLWNKLSPADRGKFDFDIAAMSWDDYTYGQVRGLRVYLVKDPMDTLPVARSRYAKLAAAHYSVVTIACCIFVWLLWTCFKFIFLW